MAHKFCTCTKTFTEVLRYSLTSSYIGYHSRSSARSSTSFHNRQCSELPVLLLRCRLAVELERKVSAHTAVSNTPNFATCKQTTFSINFKKSIIVKKLLTKAIFPRVVVSHHHYTYSAILRWLHEINKKCRRRHKVNSGR